MNQPPAAPPSPVPRRTRVLASLAPILLILAVIATVALFKWKREYGRLAREKRGREMALSHVERGRELLDRAGRLARLPAPDSVRVDDIQGLAAEAADSLETALTFAPEDEEAMRCHGQALEMSYNLEEARASYEACLPLHRETPARYLLGLLSTRQLARARLAGFKTSLIPAETLVERAVGPLRRYQAPAAEFKARIDAKNSTTCSACILYAQGEWENAARSANAAAVFDPTEWLPHYLKGLSLLELKRIDEGVQALEEAVRAAPAVADPHAGLAAAYYRMNRRVEAIRELSIALEITPHFLEAYFVRGVLLYEDGRFADARADFEACLKLRPSLSEARLKLGIAALENWRRTGRADPRDLETAERSFSEALAAQPADASALLLRAQVRMEAKDWKNAEADLTAILEKNPKDPGALALRAETAEAQDRWEPALRDYEAILQAAPGDVAALRRRARARARVGSLDAALADLDALIARDPNDPTLFAEKARLLSGAKRLDEALATLEGPANGNPRLRILRAEILLEKGDAPGAIQDATLALAADPQNADALVVRGRAWLAQGLGAKAAADWRRAIEMRPDLKPTLGPEIEKAEASK